MKNMKNFMPWIFTLMLALLSGCLPQEKTTQCGENEAFSPSQRRCVASSGATGNIVSIQSFTPQFPYTVYQNSASPTTHTVTVRDPYNNGFRTRWELARPDSSTITLANNTLTYTLIPNSGFMAVTGTYTLQFTLLDISGTEPIDTRTWTIQVVNVPTPDIVSQVPGSPVVTKLTNNTNNLNFSIDVSNPSASLLTTEWFLDGVSIGSQLSSNINYTHSRAVTHAQLSLLKTYSLQAVIKAGATTYDSHTWYITVSNPATPSITNKTPDTAITITAVDSVSMTNNGFYTTAAGVNTTVNDFCVTVSNQAGSDGTGVDVKFFRDGAPFPPSGTPANTVDIGSPTACVTDVPADPVVSLINQTIGEAHVFSARVFDKGTGVELTSVLNPVNWMLSARPANEPPVAKIDRSNIASLTNEVACFTSGTYTTPNTAVGSTVNFCRATQDTDTSFTFQVHDSDYPLNYATSSSPLPSSTTNLDRFKVDYYLNGQLLDGTHPLSDSDCSFDYTDGNVITAGTSKFSCFINFRSYTATGPLSTIGLSYTVTAKVTDHRRWPTPGTPGVESNIQTWNVTKIDESTVGMPEIAPQISAPTTGSPLLANESALFLSTDMANILPATGAAIIAENQVLAFSLALGDDERDNGVVTVTRCTSDPNVSGICNAAETPVSSTLTRNNGNRWARKVIPYTLRDNSVVGAASAQVYFQVTYSEINDTIPAPIAVVNMEVPVLNVNPAPVLQAPANTLPDPTAALPYIAFTGFPFTIDPGAITDSNQYDGNVIEYQWRYSTDESTWNIIEGGDSRVLVWTPPKDLGFNVASPTTPAQVYLQLCVGDNGFGNDVNTPGEARCTTTESTPYRWHLNVYSSAVNLAATDLASTLSSAGFGVDKAVWLDSASSTPVNYTAYGTSNTSGVNGYIIVEKTIYNSDTSPRGSVFNVTDTSEARSIIFRAFPGHANCRPRDISITGHNDGIKTDLYVSYVCKDLDSKDKLHIRHIKVVNGKTNMYHPGTFGFDYDGPNAGTQLSVSPSMSISKVSQRSVITIGAVNINDTIQFNYTSSPLTITVGTDICNPSCSGTSAMATELATYINESTDLNLQGFVATATTNQVTLDGIIEDDYHILDAQILHAGKIQIYQNGSNHYWYVPYLNAQTGSTPNINRVSIISAQVGNLDKDNIAPVQNALLTGTSQAVEITNDINTDDQSIILAVKDYTGRVNVYHYSFVSVPPASLNLTQVGTIADIFQGQLVEDIRVAVNFPGNSHSIDVVGRYSDDPSVPAGDIGKLAIYHIGENGGTYDFSSVLGAGSITPLEAYGGGTLSSGTISGSPIDLDDFSDFQIATTPNQGELILFFSTSRTNASPNELYAGKVTFDGMLNPILNCSTDTYLVCAPIAQGHTTSVRDYLTLSSVNTFDKIAISKVTPLTLGSDGAMVSEATRNIISSAYSVSTLNNGASATESEFLIQQNVINIQDETISTDGPVYSGTPYILPAP